MSSVESPSPVAPHTRALLIESAPLIEAWADHECQSKDSGGMEEWAKTQAGAERHVDSCAWYHGTWQYLRLLNMVAVPDWHDFFNSALAAVLERKPDANVLISAAADYGMLVTLHEAIQTARARPQITLYDICNTPLKASQWYADRHGLPLKCVRGNLLTANMPEAPFDLIVTDEFLSVVKDADKPQVVRRWRDLLKPGGTVVTTAMIGGVTTPELRRSYADRARQSIETEGATVSKYGNGNGWALIERFEKFASVHTRHMVGGEADVRALFSIFSTVSLRRITTPGECVNPTESIQIVASVAE